MEIASRESQLLTTIEYFDECIKTIRIWKFYADDTKTPVSRLKTVEFRNPDGTIDEDRADRADSSKLLIDKSNESETLYTYRDLKTESLINRDDGCTRTIKIWKEYSGKNNKSLYINKINEFRYPDGTINENRSYTWRLLINKRNESETLYRHRDVKLVTHINYVDGCTKTINIQKNYSGDEKKPCRRYKTAEFRNRDYTIDKNRSGHCKRINVKSGESDFEDESPDVL